VQQFIDAAADADPVERVKVVRLLFAGRLDVGVPPGNWPAPTTGDCERASAQCRAAARAAWSELLILGMTTLYTRLAELPTVRIVWDPGRPEEALPPAPLVHSLVDGSALRQALTLAAYELSPLTAPFWDEQALRSLFRRLNAVAELELMLWWLAAEGGHRDPPPYAVRYDLARWFWHPSISGAIFCLRCGNELRFARRERTQAIGVDIRPHAIRTARCRPCSRGREDNWPDHALEPYKRGTWLLRCTATGCQQVFIGSRQARYCEQHRVNRLTARKRVRPT
jgi:hypothetical protein